MSMRVESVKRPNAILVTVSGWMDALAAPEFETVGQGRSTCITVEGG